MNKFVLLLLAIIGGLIFPAHAQVVVPANGSVTENFDAGNTWTFTGTNSSWLWGNPNKAEVTDDITGGGNCLILGGNTPTSTYNLSESSNAESPVYDLTAVANPYIEFWFYHSNENSTSFDEISLQYRVGAGAWTDLATPVGTNNCYDQNWYNQTSNWGGATPAADSFVNCSFGPVGGGVGPTGWMLVRKCLSGVSAIINQPNVQFRFRITTGTSCNYYGATVDDFLVGDAHMAADFNYSCTGNSQEVGFLDISQRCPDQWNWDFGDGNTSTAQNPTHTYNAGGTYTVTLIATASTAVTAGCGGPLIDTVSYTVEVLGSNLASSSDPSCVGDADGTATLNTVGGTVGNTYTWAPAPGSGQGTASAGGLSAGTYTITTAAAGKCPHIFNITITDPPAISITSTSTAASCGAAGNGSIDLSTNGGNPTYSYNWSDGQTTEDATGLTAGNYTVTVTDANGCTTTETVNVSANSSTTISFTTTNVSCNLGTDGCIAASVSNSVGNLGYSWFNGTTADSICGLASGTYTLTVTDTITASPLQVCTIINDTTITEPPAITINIDSIMDDNCGANDGAAWLTTSGGTAPLSFAWSNGATTEDISGLTPFSYTITVTDNNGCTASNTIGINTSGSISLSLDSINNAPACINTDGGIYISDSVTTAACTSSTVVINEIMYRPNNQNGQNPNTGEYIELLGPAGLDISCYVLTDGDWTITIPSGTTIPSDGLFTIGNDIVYGAGTFDLDAENCGCFTDGTGGGGLLILTDGGEYVSLFDASGAYLEGVIYGTPTVGFNDPPNGTATTGGFINTVGAAGCLSSVNIPGPAVHQNAPGGVASGTSLARNPDGSGSFVAQAGGSLNSCNFGPVATATYLWSNGATTQDITGLGAGTYTVTATSSGGCTATETYTVTEPSTIVSNIDSVDNALCNGANNGAIYTSASSGGGPLTYSWSTGDTTANISNLTAGSYCLTITDSLGCSETVCQTLTEPAAININIDTTINILCNGDNTGSINITTTGGTPSYNYQWSNGNTTQNLSNTGANSYIVTVTDANNCISTASATINEPTPILLLDSIGNVSCGGTSDGRITITPSGGTPSYTYLWDANANNQTTATATGLASSTYSITVTDANGCTQTGNGYFVAPGVDLDSADVPLQVIQGVVACDLSPIGQLTINTTGTYTYLWSNGATTQNANGLAAGNYTVSVTNGLGCTQVQYGSIGTPFIPTLNAYIDAAGTTTATIISGDSATVSAGINQNGQGVDYTWNGATAVTFGNSQSYMTYATSNTAGTYNLTITATSTDSNACATTETVTMIVEDDFLGIPDAFTPNGDLTNDIFRPVGLDPSNIIDFKVFNRFGQLVYDGNKTNGNAGWNGLLNGTPQPRAVYVYLLTYKLGGTETTIKGQVTLLR